MLLEKIWLKCLNRFKNNLSKNEYVMWILPLQVLINKNSINLYAPNIFVLNYVRDNYLKYIYKYFSDLCINLPLINFYIGSKYSSENKFFKKNIFISKKKKEIDIKYFNKFILFKQYCFSNFIYGISNYIAYKESINLCFSSFKKCKLLFLYGCTGLGKTHLINSIGNKINDLNKNNKKIIYINSERFVNIITNSIYKNNIEKFRFYLKSSHILLVDDIQYLVNSKRSQEEFIYILDFLLQKKNILVFTSNKNIVNLNLNNRIISRLFGGIIVKIDKIDFDVKYKFLYLKSKNMSFNLNKNIINFISNLDIINIYELQGILNILFVYAKYFNCLNNINIDFVKNILYTFLKSDNSNIEIYTIQKIVSNYYRITILDLLSKSRYRSFVYPRQMSIAISKRLTHYSLSKLGFFFGGLDHSTIIYSYKKIEKLYITNNVVKSDFNNLIKLILSSKYEIFYKKKKNI